MSRDFGFRISDFGFQTPRKRRARSVRSLPSKFRISRAVTLVELLITITIISILSAAFLGTSNLAMESSRKARTKTTIGKLHGLLMEKWNEYATRRVRISPGGLDELENIIKTLPANLQGRIRGEARADLRLLALRELMLQEMPDSWSDILLLPVGNLTDNPEILSTSPAITKAYYRRYLSLKKDPSVSEEIDDIIANQGAECLYMIIMLSTADGEARTLFSEQDIGDTDGDGAPEFLDGWGRPIHFIRWPAGFTSRSDIMQGTAASDHDPFDVFRRDQEGITRPNSGMYPQYPSGAPDFSARIHVEGIRQRNANGISAFRMVPLIYSAGPDGVADIDDLAFTGAAPPTYLDPYAIDPNGASATPFVTSPSYFVFGTPADMNGDGDDNSLDNIHNHLQDNK